MRIAWGGIFGVAVAALGIWALLYALGLALGLSSIDQDFWKTWNKGNYDAVKARTDPHNIFRDLYSKTCRAARGIKDQPVATGAERNLR